MNNLCHMPQNFHYFKTLDELATIPAQRYCKYLPIYHILNPINLFFIFIGRCLCIRYHHRYQLVCFIVTNSISFSSMFGIHINIQKTLDTKVYMAGNRVWTVFQVQLPGSSVTWLTFDWKRWAEEDGDNFNL